MTTKTVFRRQVIRAAVRIQEHLCGPARRAQIVTLPQPAWEELSRTVKYLRYVEHKGWHCASESLIQDIDYAALRFQREMEVLRKSLVPRTTSKPFASASEIASELLAMEDEFEEVKLDLKAHTVAAQTSGIELEGVYLGPFRIVLNWERIGQAQQPYSVYAQEPCHANGREDVTHPHVLNHQLCEGEGSTSIKEALTSGRLGDFFILVRQILGTYNPESAHVSLSDWDGGMSCDGCGTSLSEDEYSTCERCDDRYCDECIWCCNGCKTPVCGECSDFCAKCGSRFCDACLTTPAGTTTPLCDDCLQAQQKDDSDEPRENAAPQPPASPTASEAPTSTADPIRVGQVVALAQPRRNRSGRVRRQPDRRPATPRRRTARAAAVHVGDS